MLCFSMGFSAFVPVRAESVHSECEHITPPKVSEENWGYGHDSTYHWITYATVVRCSKCNSIMQVVSTRNGDKQEHDRNSPGERCKICNN